MRSYRSVWVLMGPYESLIFLMDSNGCLWVLIFLDAYLCVRYASTRTHKDALRLIRTGRDWLESIRTNKEL